MKACGKTFVLVLAALAITLTLDPNGSTALADSLQAGLRGFDGTGVVDDIRPDSVIVNDIYLRLAPDVQFRSLDAAPSELVTVKRGDKVGYMKDADGRVAELWRLRQ